MSLTVGINKSKHVSKWFDYVDENGAVLAKFKIRGISYKPYQVAIERSRQILGISNEIKLIDNLAKTSQEMLLTCTAYHLIEDWSGVYIQSINDDGELEKKEIQFSQDNANDIIVYGGDDGMLIWDFINTNAKRLQAEHDKEKDEILGKSKRSTGG